MTRDEIIRMAREAGFEGLIEKAWGIEQLERFAAIVAANEREQLLANDESLTLAYMVGIREGRLAEREACAKVCDGVLGRQNGVSAAIRERSANARARGEK